MLDLRRLRRLLSSASGTIGDVRLGVKKDTSVICQLVSQQRAAKAQGEHAGRTHLLPVRWQDWHSKVIVLLIGP